MNLRPKLSTDKSVFLTEKLVGYLVGSKHTKVTAGVQAQEETPTREII